MQADWRSPWAMTRGERQFAMGSVVGRGDEPWGAPNVLHTLVISRAPSRACRRPASSSRTSCSPSTSTPPRDADGAGRAGPVPSSAPVPQPQARAAPGVDEGLRGTAARGGLPTSYVASSADHPSDARLVEVLARHPVSRLEVYDVVDDWRGRNLQQVARLAGAELTVHETPAFLTPRTPSCGRWPQAPAAADAAPLRTPKAPARGGDGRRTVELRHREPQQAAPRHRG
jgi:hypothetical protein